MAADLPALYAKMAEDVDGSLLAPPKELRERADRRSRLVTVAAALTLAAGVAAAGVAVSTRAEPTPAAPPAPILSIPDRAFLVPHPAVTRGAEPVPGGPYLPANFCPDHPPVDAGVRERRARTLPYYTGRDATAPEGTAVQTITRYAGDAAAAAMTGLRDVADRCRTAGVDVVADGDRPPADDHLALAVGRPRGPVAYVVAVRVGDVVSVLLVRGADGTDADYGVTDDLTDRAVAALVAWSR